MHEITPPVVGSDSLRPPVFLERLFKRRFSYSRTAYITFWSLFILAILASPLKALFPQSYWLEEVEFILEGVSMFTMLMLLNLLGILGVSAGWSACLFWTGFTLLQGCLGYVFLGLELPVSTLVHCLLGALLPIGTMTATLVAFFFGAEIDAACARFGKRIVGRS